MSNKVGRHPDNHMHGLRDDMESLYYVVLYSGICWLPHNVVENLGMQIKNFFYDCQYDGTTTRGGYSKASDLDDGHFFKKFVWKDDKATQTWMKDAWAIQKLEKSRSGFWTPGNFMKIWTKIQNFDPAKSNRCEHDVLINGRNIYSWPHPTTSSVSCAVSLMSGMASITNKNKRSLEGEGSFAAQESRTSYKKQRAGTADAGSSGQFYDPEENPFLQL